MDEWYDLVREYFPDATDISCKTILWEKTSFPWGGLERVKYELKKLEAEWDHRGGE